MSISITTLVDFKAEVVEALNLAGTSTAAPFNLVDTGIVDQASIEAGRAASTVAEEQHSQ